MARSNVKMLIQAIGLLISRKYVNNIFLLNLASIETKVKFYGKLQMVHCPHGAFPTIFL